ncbi:NAD-dependent epimerase/dehydratase family protein [Nioella nitratireducens]|uniref:NAD-dependent epimerase/dehydratase family protein n=1 Tax=Nioella nitratireducens TaxID=1287720 RepID=UPI0008FD3BEE|nr:NAD(P)-dependent oxidoreductase [Nioella nitratireducens]
MRVLVLGATGRLGQMLQWGWQHESRLTPVWHGRTATDRRGWRRFDITQEPDALHDACREVDVVLCLAGITPASGASLDLNTELALAASAAAGQTPLLIASSAAVFGRAGHCKEDDAPQPVAPYGMAKLAMETAVEAAATGPVTCLRIGNVAGADQILGRAGIGQALTLDQFADGRTPARSYIGPATLAKVLVTLCRAAGDGLPSVLNVAAPGMVEMGELLDAIPYPWQPRPAPVGAIAEVLLDTDRLSRFMRLDPTAGCAENLIKEWRAFRAETDSE